MSKKKKITLKRITPVALAGLVLIGTNAWLFNRETQTAINTIKTGTIDVKFIDTSDLLKREDYVINLTGNSMIPMTEKFANENLNPYIFTIKNGGDVDVRYTLYLVTDESEFEPNIINVDMDGKFEGETNVAPQKVNQDRQAIDTGILKAKDRITYDKFILFANEGAESANMLNVDGSGRKAKYHLEIDAEQISNVETPPTNPDEVVDKYLTVGGAYYNDNGERKFKGGNITSYLKSTSEEELTTKLETATFDEILNIQSWNNLKSISNAYPRTIFWDTDINEIVWVESVIDGVMTVYEIGLVPSNNKVSDYLVKETTTGNAEYTWNFPKFELRTNTETNPDDRMLNFTLDAQPMSISMNELDTLPDFKAVDDTTTQFAQSESKILYRANKAQVDTNAWKYVLDIATEYPVSTLEDSGEYVSTLPADVYIDDELIKVDKGDVWTLDTYENNHTFVATDTIVTGNGYYVAYNDGNSKRIIMSDGDPIRAQDFYKKDHYYTYFVPNFTVDNQTMKLSFPKSYLTTLDKIPYISNDIVGIGRDTTDTDKIMYRATTSDTWKQVKTINGLDIVQGPKYHADLYYQEIKNENIQYFTEVPTQKVDINGYTTSISLDCQSDSIPLLENVSNTDRFAWLANPLNTNKKELLYRENTTTTTWSKVYYDSLTEGKVVVMSDNYGGNLGKLYSPNTTKQLYTNQGNEIPFTLNETPMTINESTLITNGIPNNNTDRWARDSEGNLMYREDLTSDFNYVVSPDTYGFGTKIKHSIETDGNYTTTSQIPIMVNSKQYSIDIRLLPMTYDATSSDLFARKPSGNNYLVFRENSSSEWKTLYNTKDKTVPMDNYSDALNSLTTNSQLITEKIFTLLINGQTYSYNALSGLEPYDQTENTNTKTQIALNDRSSSYGNYYELMYKSNPNETGRFAWSNIYTESGYLVYYDTVKKVPCYNLDKWNQPQNYLTNGSKVVATPTDPIVQTLSINGETLTLDKNNITKPFYPDDTEKGLAADRRSINDDELYYRSSSSENWKYVTYEDGTKIRLSKNIDKTKDLYVYRNVNLEIDGKTVSFNKNEVLIKYDESNSINTNFALADNGLDIYYRETTASEWKQLLKQNDAIVNINTLRSASENDVFKTSPLNNN